MIKKSFLVCVVSNALDGSQNHIIRCVEELPELSIAYSSTDSSDKDPFESSGPEDGQNEKNSCNEEVEATSESDEEAETSSSGETEPSCFDEVQTMSNSDEKA